MLKSYDKNFLFDNSYRDNHMEGVVYERTVK